MKGTYFNITDNIIGELITLFIEKLDYNKPIMEVLSTIENMFWYYLDKYCQDNRPSKDKFLNFLSEICNKVPFLIHPKVNIMNEFHKWQKTRNSMKRCLSILIDNDRENILVIRGRFSKLWNFPGGKMDIKDTNSQECAMREAYEEVGYNTSGKIDETLTFEINYGFMIAEYFVVPDVSINTYFVPLEMNEIGEIQWISLDENKWTGDEEHYKLIREAVSKLKCVINEQ